MRPRDFTKWLLESSNKKVNFQFQKMELLHVIIKSGPSPRPLAWSLEVSSSDNGEDWRIVRAFGDKDHCRKLWDLRPERRRRKARAVKRTSRAEKMACSTLFTSPRPLENGEVSLDKDCSCYCHASIKWRWSTCVPDIIFGRAFNYPVGHLHESEWLKIWEDFYQGFFININDYLVKILPPLPIMIATMNMK